MRKSAKKNLVDTIKTFWGNVVENEEISIQHRLKASELLIKMEGENIGNEAVVISGEDDLED